MATLKGIDFKSLIIQKGERFLLWAMVGIMAVLVVFGVFINGFSRGSSSGTSQEIKKLYQAGQSAVNRSEPTPEMTVIDRQFTRASQMPGIDFDIVQCTNAYFTSIPGE